MVVLRPKEENESGDAYSLRLGVEVWVFPRFGLNGIEPADGGAFFGSGVGDLEVDGLT